MAFVGLGIFLLLIWVAIQFAFWWDEYRSFGLRFNWRTLISHRWFWRWRVIRIVQWFEEREDDFH